MSELKVCKHCHEAKEPIKDFYLCSGRWRSECKACTIKKNVSYQKRVKAWRYRYADTETRKTYMRKYYEKNKNKFAKYRTDFKQRHPGYYQDYFRSRKEKDDAKR